MKETSRLTDLLLSIGFYYYVRLFILLVLLVLLFRSFFSSFRSVLLLSKFCFIFLLLWLFVVIVRHHDHLPLP